MIKKDLEKVYLSLGGNLGQTKKVFEEAIYLLSKLNQTKYLQSSSIYLTSPVTTVPQFSYLNMVCCFETTLEPLEFFAKIEEIEAKLGKAKKEKDLPRIIDIDILFFGKRKINTQELIIPHPRWKERLFVLIPLAEILEKITFDDEEVDIKELINRFENKQREVVTLFF